MTASIRPHQTDSDDDSSSDWSPPGSDQDVGSDAAEDFIRRHPSVIRLARIGWAAKGVVYSLTLCAWNSLPFLRRCSPSARTSRYSRARRGVQHPVSA